MKKKSFILFISIIVIVCFTLIFSGFASVERSLKTFDSELNGGLDRTIVIYTHTGDVIAEYNGKIDIQTTDGGKLLFDLNGKRYIYYNCLVEVIEK